MPKRNAHGSGTIRQRPDGTWEARYTTGRNPGTGRQIQKSVYAKTQAEVRKKLNAATAAIDEGTYSEPAKLTVGQWLDIWLKEYVEHSVKPLTLASYRHQCESYIKPQLGKVRLSALTTAQIQAFYNALLRDRGEKPGLSPKSVKNVHGAFGMALKQAVTLGYIKYSPADACTMPRAPKKEIKPLEDTEAAAFLKAIEGSRFETLYKVTLFTGMRQGEVLGLMWDCVAFDRGTITIKQQLQKGRENGGQYYFAPLKNDQTRVITPAPYVMELLREHRRRQLEAQLKAGAAWERSGLVFTNELGAHLSNRTVYTHFKIAVDAIGRPDARFHDLRHSYAVASLQAGDPVKTVQQNLGHATAAFTLDVYGHVSEQMKKDSAARMEAHIKALKNL